MKTKVKEMVLKKLVDAWEGLELSDESYEKYRDMVLTALKNEYTLELCMRIVNINRLGEFWDKHKDLLIETHNYLRAILTNQGIRVVEHEGESYLVCKQMEWHDDHPYNYHNKEQQRLLAEWRQCTTPETEIGLFEKYDIIRVLKQGRNGHEQTMGRRVDVYCDELYDKYEELCQDTAHYLKYRNLMPVELPEGLPEELPAKIVLS